MSCSEFSDIFDQDENNGLTNSEVVNGLKQALVIGSDSASSILSVTDGYYKDELVKILLPPEAEIITENIKLLPGGEQMITDIVKRINRSAEDAAKEAAPVFSEAVTSMSIKDGWDILTGEDDAATQYLHEQTFDELYLLYQPKIKTSLDKKLIGNISTNDSWETLTTEWNKIATSLTGQFAGLEPVETQLDAHLTNQALNGLFLKLANEEAKIRNNPIARVTDLLKKVFGQS
jgi:hypothetical protein